MKVFPLLDLCDSRVVLGQHAAWLPPTTPGALGIKVPFQWGGRITKYSQREKTYDLESLRHEYTILRALAEVHAAPTIGEWVYFQAVRSNYLGFEWTDPCGAFGYEMQDADGAHGQFVAQVMKRLPIAGSEGAWNDLYVPERQNIRNGYVVDVRRTVWDMLQWLGEEGLAELPARPVPDDVLGQAAQKASFPKGERSEPYQEYCLGGVWQAGARDVRVRAEAMGFVPRAGDSVVDVGCHVGGFLQYAALCTAGEAVLVGTDIDPDYIEFGRALAGVNQQNIYLFNADVVTGTEAFITKIRRIVDRPTHLLLLSLWKHIGSGVLWQIVDALNARHTYIESQPTQDGATALDTELTARGGRRVGESNDRNRRILFRIDKD